MQLITTYYTYSTSGYRRGGYKHNSFTEVQYNTDSTERQRNTIRLNMVKGRDPKNDRGSSSESQEGTNVLSPPPSTHPPIKETVALEAVTFFIGCFRWWLPLSAAWAESQIKHKWIMSRWTQTDTVHMCISNQWGVHCIVHNAHVKKWNIASDGLMHIVMHT